MSDSPIDEVVANVSMGKVMGSHVLKAADLTTRAGLVDNQTLQEINGVLSTDLFLKNEKAVKLSGHKESDY